MWGKFFCLFGVASHGIELKHAVSGREKVDFHLYKYLILAAGKQEIHIQIFSCNFVTVQTCTLNILFWIQTFSQLTGYLVWLSLTVSYLVLLWLSLFVKKKTTTTYLLNKFNKIDFINRRNRRNQGAKSNPWKTALHINPPLPKLYTWHNAVRQTPVSWQQRKPGSLIRDRIAGFISPENTPPLL